MSDEDQQDDAEHGVAATHPDRDAQPFLVAPTTASAFNVLSIDLVAVACVMLEDVLFEFDSSFPNRKVAKMLSQVPGLREKHRNSKGEAPPLSVFGHADPVGDDKYNKQLSGRRSMAIYALLTHDLDLWNFLFDTPSGGDNWKAKNFQELMRKEVGAAKGTPRKALSTAYMELLSPVKLEKVDFLGKGADSKGKADFQGCSEFNPLVLLSQSENKSLPHAKRNEENAVNRRVLIFLFRPGTNIKTSNWPCPTALAGTADCIKRFFGPPKTGDERRKAGPQRRRFDDTRDTFACRFYDRVSKLSPCESPVPPPPPPPLLGVNPLIFFGASSSVAAASGSTVASASSLVPASNVGKISIANDIVLVKKPYTNPHRVEVVLKTDQPFDGRGTLTVNDKDRIFLFPTLASKTKLAFNGSDNVFTGAQLNPAGPGVTLFAEGHTASQDMKDFILTLRLSGGTKKRGPDAVGRMTAIELVLDICEPRVNDTTDPTPLPQAPETPSPNPTDKFFLGRPIPIQDDAKIQERAKLIVQPVKTRGFAALNKQLVLVRIGPNVTTFGDETKSDVVIPSRHTFAASAQPIAFFVEGGPNASAKARENNYQLGIDGLDGDGDRVQITVVHSEIISNKEPKDVKTVAIVKEKPERKTKSTKFFPAPIIIGRHFPIELRPFVLLARPSAFEWTSKGGATLTLTNTTSQVLKLTATSLSTAENDTLIQVRVTSDLGVFLRRHRLMAVTVTIDPVSANHPFTTASDVNDIKNPPAIVILSGADVNDAKKVAKIEMIKFGRSTPGAPAGAAPTVVADAIGIEPNLTFTDDDDRISWWIIGDDGGEYRGKAEFRNVESAQRGTKIEVQGTVEGDVLIQPYSGGFGYGMFRASVLPLRQIKYRINRVFTQFVAPKPGKPGRAAHAPTRSHLDAKNHIDIANIFLRQVGIQLIPDNSTQVAARPPGNPQIGLSGLDRLVVAVTQGAGAAAGSTVDGGFDVEVNDASLTFRATDFRTDQAIQINARNEIITIAYVESLLTNNAVAQANFDPTNHTPGRVLKDKGTPSSSLIVKSGIPDQTPVGEVKMTVLQTIGLAVPQPATPAGGKRTRALLWGIVVPTRSSDVVATNVPMSQDLLYGSTLAHEVGHVLGLNHRTTTPPFADRLRTPRDKNLMFPGTTVNMESLDIVQCKAIRNSEVLRRNP